MRKVLALEDVRPAYVPLAWVFGRPRLGEFRPPSLGLEDMQAEVLH